MSRAQILVTAAIGLVLAAAGLVPRFADGPAVPLAVTLATAVAGIFVILAAASVPLASAARVPVRQQRDRV